MVDEARQSGGERCGFRRHEQGSVGIQDLGMRSKIGRHDGPSRSEVRVDLQGRIGPARAWGHQNVTGGHEAWNLLGRALTGEDHEAPGRFGALSRLLGLFLGAPDHEHARLGMSDLEHRGRLGQQIKSLVGFEGARIEHDRLVGVETVAVSQLARGVWRPPVDIASHHVFYQGRAIFGAESDGGVLELLTNRDNHP